MHTDLAPNKSSKSNLTSLLGMESENKTETVNLGNSHSKTGSACSFLSFICFLLCLHCIGCDQWQEEKPAVSSQRLFEHAEVWE